MKKTAKTDAIDIMAESLDIKSTDIRPVGGTWVNGSIMGHDFQALCFKDHAENQAFEVNGDSRISKLWIRRQSDKKVVYNWDRGMDFKPQTKAAEMIVGFLSAGLAEFADYAE